MEKSELFGRLVPGPLPAGLSGDPHVQQLPVIRRWGPLVWCLRCGQVTWWRGQLPRHHAYCPQCIQLGRVSTLAPLYTIPEPNKFRPGGGQCTWRGRLSPAQASLAAKIKQAVERRQRVLVWAVTGAGKTEMLFPGLAAGLTAGWRVGIVTPRIDVCRELFPRLRAAFPAVTAILLTGDEPGPYRYTQLVVATTHQLLRFYRAFDLLVIDEVDAFPFITEKGLHYAAARAIKKNAAILLLTATPSARLLRIVRRHHFQVGVLPARYHGHPLPEPHLVRLGRWERLIYRRMLPTKIQATLAEWREHFPVLIFVPRIRWLKPVLRAIQRQFPTWRGTSVYAADPRRQEKVTAMRKRQVQYLVTTTILERGVTFPGVQVVILGADDPVFTVAALVQIAGRVGRSPTAPTGTVLFGCARITPVVRAARRQICTLNRTARRMAR